MNCFFFRLIDTETIVKVWSNHKNSMHMIMDQYHACRCHVSMSAGDVKHDYFLCGLVQKQVRQRYDNYIIFNS